MGKHVANAGLGGWFEAQSGLTRGLSHATGHPHVAVTQTEYEGMRASSTLQAFEASMATATATWWGNQSQGARDAMYASRVAWQPWV